MNTYPMQGFKYVTRDGRARIGLTDNRYARHIMPIDGDKSTIAWGRSSPGRIARDRYVVNRPWGLLAERNR